jgi:hypothetical protein
MVCYGQALYSISLMQNAIKTGFFVIPAQAGIQNSLFFWFEKPGLRLSPERPTVINLFALA